MTAPFEAQLEALGADLLALDEDEAQAALKEVQEQVERLTRHAERLRVAVELRAAWIAATEQTASTSPGTPTSSAASNGRKPKTKDVLVAAFRAEPAREFTTKELRGILHDQGISITPEGTRLALRRLIADKVIVKPSTGRYQFRNPFLAIENA